VVGVNLVGVPLGNVNALAMERSLAVVGLLTGLFGVLMFTMQFSVRRNIIRPLVEIASSAQAVSQGDMGRRIETNRNDEIGELARAFELMRRSLQSMMRRANP
jgi:HAMP domain-containing protein